MRRKRIGAGLDHGVGEQPDHVERRRDALAEGRDPGDLTTIEDPAALEQIRVAVAEKGRSDT